MNASRLTVVIAQGIYLYARVMDLPILAGRTVQQEDVEWEQWRMENPKLVAFVEREQFNLFDRVNGTF